MKELEELIENLSSPVSSSREGALENLAIKVQEGCSDLEVKLIKSKSLKLLEHTDIQARSFAVLALEALVRFEQLDDQEMHLKVMNWYLNEADLRGYSVEVGWIHSVAHGADYLATCLAQSFLDASTVISVLIERIVTSEIGWTHMEDARLARVLCLAFQRVPKLFTDFVRNIESHVDLLGSTEKFGIQHNLRSVLLSLYLALQSKEFLPKDQLNQLLLIHQKMTPYLFEEIK